MEYTNTVYAHTHIHTRVNNAINSYSTCPDLNSIILIIAFIVDTKPTLQVCQIFLNRTVGDIPTCHSDPLSTPSPACGWAGEPDFRGKGQQALSAPAPSQAQSMGGNTQRVGGKRFGGSRSTSYFPARLGSTAGSDNSHSSCWALLFYGCGRVGGGPVPSGLCARRALHWCHPRVGHHYADSLNSQPMYPQIVPSFISAWLTHLSMMWPGWYLILSEWNPIQKAAPFLDEENSNLETCHVSSTTKLAGSSLPELW